MKEESFLDLSSKEQEKVLVFRESQVELNDSNARLETATKWRLVFERAPEDTIPFIIYCVEVVAVALIGLFKVIDLDGEKLYIGSGIIFLSLFFPLLLLPGKSWRAIWKWFREDVLKRRK